MLETWSSQEALPHRGFSTVSGPVPTAALEAASWEPCPGLPGPHALTAGKPRLRPRGSRPGASFRAGGGRRGAGCPWLWAAEHVTCLLYRSSPRSVPKASRHVTGEEFHH